jgi:hypothetical protein
MSNYILQKYSMNNNSMRVSRQVSPLRLFHRYMPMVLRSSYRHSILPVLGTWAWLVAFPWPLRHTYNHIPVSPRLDRIDSRILCDKDSSWSCRCGDRGFNVALVHTKKNENCSTLWAFSPKLVSLVLALALFQPEIKQYVVAFPAFPAQRCMSDAQLQGEDVDNERQRPRRRASRINGYLFLRLYIKR